MIKKNSLIAYDSIKPALNKNQSIVLNNLRIYGPASNYELAKRIGWDINCVTPRTGELKSMGRIDAQFDRIGHKGRPETVWAYVPEEVWQAKRPLQKEFQW